jgi:hypothetical protein
MFVSLNYVQCHHEEECLTEDGPFMLDGFCQLSEKTSYPEPFCLIQEFKLDSHIYIYT